MVDNNVTLNGRSTKEPEVKVINTAKGEQSVARFTLAVRRNKDQSDFIPCVAWGKTAEFVRNYVKKGERIGVAGSIKTGSYTNRDGKKVYTVDVEVNEVSLRESKGATGTTETAEAPKPVSANPEPQPTAAGFEGLGSIASPWDDVML